jgi:acyl-coenzyme A thioesterase PaaI-like protein
MRRLHNEDWGFESNCIVCEPKNDRGLAIPFHHDEAAGTVVAEYELGGEFSGAPTYVHGGVTLAILDEAMAWATIAVGGKFAVTEETSARFQRPCKVGRHYRVEASVTGADDERMRTHGRVLDDRDRVCVEADATFVVLSPAAASAAVGAELTDAEAGYVREPDAGGGERQE